MSDLFQKFVLAGEPAGLLLPRDMGKGLAWRTARPDWPLYVRPLDPLWPCFARGGDHSSHVCAPWHLLVNAATAKFFAEEFIFSPSCQRFNGAC